MTRAEDRARAKRAARKAAEREAAERAALASFVPTPRPTVLARAVQRVLGAPAVDDPIHGHRAVTLQRIREDLGLETATPTAPNGSTPPRDGAA